MNIGNVLFAKFRRVTGHATLDSIGGAAGPMLITGLSA
jgi:hypothetical protein